MDYRDIIAALEEVGLKCRYGKYTSPPIPYCVIKETHNADIYAEGINYVDVPNVQLDYYNYDKCPPDEKKIQNMFKELGLPYRKREFFNETENLRQIIYEVQLIGG